MGYVYSMRAASSSPDLQKSERQHDAIFRHAAASPIISKEITRLVDTSKSVQIDTEASGKNVVKKLILLVVIVIAGSVWYFDLSRKMTETAVRENYASQLAAMERFDAVPLCASLDDDFQGTIITRGAATEIQDKQQACAEITRTMRRLKMLSERTSGMLEPDYEVQIHSITLSASHKLATVESTTVMRLGKMTLARAHAIEHLIRRQGRIRSTGGETTVWAYRGE